jgi:phage shock protein E
VPVLPRYPFRAGWVALALGMLTACAGQPAPSPAAPPPPHAAAEAPPPILAEVPSVSAAELATALARPEPRRRPLVLDVRRDDEFAEGHVPGAVHIPHDRLAARLAELAGAQDREVVVYCRSGRRAALALETLKNAGFRRLAHLQGDYPGWAEAQAAGQAPPEPGATGVAPPEVPE